MGDERIGGAFQNAAGQVQDAAGGLIGDTKTQAAHNVREATAKVQDAYRDAVDQARGAAAGVARLIEEQPFAALAVIGVVAFLSGWLAHRR